MTAFAILRIQKHSSLASLAGVARHHSRQSRARGCDPDKSPRNLSFGAASSGSAGVVAAVGSVIEQAQAKQSKAFRRDAVKAVEFMFTASPEWWKTASPKYRSAFFDRARRWLREKHPGGVVAEWVHLDERSPHLHAVVVPLHEGRLNARHFFGGAKKLEALQDEFASLMQPLGLVRGVRGSDAPHLPVSAWWSALDRPPEPVKRSDYLRKSMGLPAPAVDQAEKKAAAFEAVKKEAQRLRAREALVSKKEADNALDEGTLKRERASVLKREQAAQAIERENRALKLRLQELAPKAPSPGYLSDLGLA